MYQYAEECVFFSAVAQVSADQPEIALSGIVIEGSFSEFGMYVSDISYGAAFAEEMAVSDGRANVIIYWGRSDVVRPLNRQCLQGWRLDRDIEKSERCGKALKRPVFVRMANILWYVESKYCGGAFRWPVSVDIANRLE